MKKYIAMLLAAILLCTSASGLALAAGSDTEEPILLFSDDFSALSEGGKPVVGVKDEQWTQTVENADKKLFVTGKADGRNMTLYIHSEEGGQAGSPRIAKRMDLRNYSKLTVEFKAKSGGVTLGFNFSGKGGVPDTRLCSVDSYDWQSYRVEIDLVEGVCDIYMGRQCIEKGKTIKLPDLSSAEVRFNAAAQPRMAAYVDYVAIYGVPLSDADIATAAATADA